MPAYNTQFELGVEDLDLIEAALLSRNKELSLKRLALLAENCDEAELARINQTLAETHDLMGRLHNQKVFFRPTKTQTAPYVGG